MSAYRRRTARLASVALLAAVVLAGCSGGSDTSNDINNYGPNQTAPPTLAPSGAGHR